MIQSICQLFHKNPRINPRNGKSILIGSNTYKSLVRRCGEPKFIDLNLNDECKNLYDFLLPLRDNRFYSYEINYTSETLNIPLEILLKYSHDEILSESITFEYLTGDWVNIFTFNNITYIGLESERLRYDQDSDLGINYVENLIQKGVYD